MAEDTEAIPTPDVTESTGVTESTETETASEDTTDFFGKEAPTEDDLPSHINVGDSMTEDEEVDHLVEEVLQSEEISEEDIAELDDISDEELDELVDELMSDEGDEAETSESEEEASEPLEEEQTDEIEDLISNRTQKRIDKLTAKEKAANEENELLKAQIEELRAKVDGITKPEEKKEEAKYIPDAQIAEAIQKGMEEGDHTVIVDAMTYIAEKVKKETLAEQEKERELLLQKSAHLDAEWQSLAKEYTPEAYQYESLKNDPDFNLNNRESKLFRLANAIFDRNGYGKVDGGQSRAVREAYSILLENKLEGGGKPKPIQNETEGLKNRLGKEQRKKTVLSGSSTAGEKSKTKPVTESSELDDYIKGRQARKNQTLGVDI